MEEDFDGSFRTEDGGRLLGLDLPAMGFEGAGRGLDGGRDLARLIGQDRSGRLAVKRM